ncbi:MAG TPA: 3-deoxy-D-manno-octulosonic acid transferase [Candidatus Binataceae bacterium]|nr:3-deoxy-D-manno-octulosonic acid transferase [Candidatus Binataceae bacterium]
MADSSPAQSTRPPKSLEPQPLGAAAWISRSLYNLAWYPALPLALLATGGRAEPVRRQRLGRDDSLPALGSATRIWLHASSVGEIEALRPIALGLLEQEPAAVLIVTAMTETGREAARRRIPGAAACRLAPLDHPLAVRAFLAASAPDVVLISEAELWPNYLFESHRFGARVALVNARVSARSFGRYRLMRPLWAAALNCADLLLAQSQPDADRFVALGAPPAQVIITGNTKFGDADQGIAAAHPALERFAGAAPTLIAGSTAPGEEAMVLDAYGELRRQFPGIRLVLAPRHLERVGEIEALLAARQLEYAKATGLKAGVRPSPSADVLLLDTLGDLRLLYRCATLAFVGGSLFEGRGGQNLGEPAAAGLAVLFGPFHQNQRETAQALLAHGGGEVVANAREMAEAGARLLRDDTGRRERGVRAREVYDNLAGGAARTLLELRALIGRR